MRRVIWLVLLTSLSFSGLTGAQQASPPASPAFDQPVPLQPIDRFIGRLTLKGKSGQPAELQVVVRTWLIPNRQRIDRFPQEGLLIVQLRVGELVAIIDGERRSRRPDDFWMVPAGSTMAIETGQDSVVLQTLATIGSAN